jgi:hypothetical protein
MTEDDFLAEVGALASRLGLLWAHFNAVFKGRRDTQGDRGFPDLVIAGSAGHLFAELKLDGGSLNSGQHGWKWRLLAGGASWFLWYPADLLSGRIEAELKRLI